MRVAVCISGQARDVKKTLDNIKNAWFGYDELDFFIHTWYYIDEKSYRIDTPSDLSSSNIDFILEKLKPKSILVEDQRIFDYKFDDSVNFPCFNVTKNPNPSQNIQSMFYSIYKSNQLRNIYEKENNFRYDCVIRCRFDYFFTKKYDISKFDLTKLNVKDDCKHNEYSINDHLAISNGYNMDIYSNIFTKLKIYYQNKIEFNPEVLLGYHMFNSCVEIEKNLGSDESFVSTKDERRNNK